MGGSNETKISNLRLHVSNDNIHIHDDAKNQKFETSTKNFKEDINDAFEDLENSEGIIQITGNKSDNLYIMRIEKNFKMFLIDKDSNIKKELQSFIKSL